MAYFFEGPEQLDILSDITPEPWSIREVEDYKSGVVFMMPLPRDPASRRYVADIIENYAMHEMDGHELEVLFGQHAEGIEWLNTARIIPDLELGVSWPLPNDIKEHLSMVAMLAIASCNGE